MWSQNSNMLIKNYHALPNFPAWLHSIQFSDINISITLHNFLKIQVFRGRVPLYILWLKKKFQNGVRGSFHWPDFFFFQKHSDCLWGLRVHLYFPVFDDTGIYKSKSMSKPIGQSWYHCIWRMFPAPLHLVVGQILGTNSGGGWGGG